MSDLVFRDTTTTFLKSASMAIGDQLKLIYQNIETGTYGPYLLWCDLEGAKRIGLTTSGLMSNVARGIIQPGDTCLLTYEGTQESDKKGFKPFHKFKVQIGKQPQSKKAELKPQVSNSTIEATKATWDNFEFEEV